MTRNHESARGLLGGQYGASEDDNVMAALQDHEQAIHDLIGELGA